MQLNLNLLKIFECVFRHNSMTTAAHELHLTQSGVSQHISSLEEFLGVALFDRINRKLIPTPIAKSLYESSIHSLREIEHAISHLKGAEVQLSGLVNIGIPMEFGNNIILPKISEFCGTHSKIRFSFHYGLATEMNDSLLNGKLDFAFVDGLSMDKRITLKTVYTEDLVLCASKELIRDHRKKYKSTSEENRNFFETLGYVDYQIGEPILHMWFSHHYKIKKPQLNVRAAVMNVQGVAQLIRGHIGAGILPDHLIQKLEKDGISFHLFSGCGKPLRNKISVAYLADKTQSPAAREALTWLMTSLDAT